MTLEEAKQKILLLSAEIHRHNHLYYVENAAQLDDFDFDMLLKQLEALEQEFPQLSPVKRRGNRRYYQRQDVLMIRQIRALLYDEGFTITGARQRLSGAEQKEDKSQSKQLVKQMIAELEDLLKTIKQ